MITARKQRKFWYVHETHVSEETGYECQPNEGAWWFPACGYTVFEGGGHIHNTKDAALKQLGRNLKKDFSDANKKWAEFQRKHQEYL